MLAILLISLNVQSNVQIELRDKLLALVWKDNARDPFQRPLQVSCTELASQYLEQITQWELRGLVLNENYFQAWLRKNNGIWVSIYSDLKQDLLLPWKINQINDYSMILSTELPMYCQKSLIFTLSIQGK